MVPLILMSCIFAVIFVLVVLWHALVGAFTELANPTSTSRSESPSSEPYEVQTLRRLCGEASNSKSVEISRSPAAARVARFSQYVRTHSFYLCDRSRTPPQMLSEFDFNLAFCSPEREEDREQFDQNTALVTEVIDAINAIDPECVFINTCGRVRVDPLVEAALRRITDLFQGYADPNRQLAER